MCGETRDIIITVSGETSNLAYFCSQVAKNNIYGRIQDGRRKNCQYFAFAYKYFMSTGSIQ